MNDFVASFFKFQERKTTWQRETIGGITSFGDDGVYHFRQSTDHGCCRYG